jgi:hypothetical protein
MNPIKTVIIIILIFAFGTAARAQVPQIINYQGRVSVAGTNFDGTGQFKFALMDASGTQTYWSNGVNVVSLTVTKGLYSVLLGDTSIANMASVIPTSVFTNASIWLRVWFNDGTSGFQQLTPDQRLAAAGYALQAASLLSTNDVVAARLNIGAGNSLNGRWATMSGGTNNIVNGFAATVGGGYWNKATNDYATVAGGALNTATNAGTVGGGGFNYAGFYATVAGGNKGLAQGDYSTIVGGIYNTAKGTYATVAGGFQCLANGEASFAAGYGAQATHTDAFVWSSGALTSSYGDNTFTVRAPGGARFYTDLFTTSTGVQLAAGGGSWSTLSDRNAKENFETLDCRKVLERLAAVPVTKWNLKSQPAAIRHIGPMAQDFYAAFNVGEDDRHISTSDADGVAFAAIKGLYQELKEKDARIAELEKRLAELEARMQRLGDSGGKRIAASGPD